MTQPNRTDKQSKADQRRQRQAAELRANLKKRKQQARDRGAAQHPTVEGAQREGQRPR
jgi:hypothetical protein